jgi:hypothetical protein
MSNTHLCGHYLFLRKGDCPPSMDPPVSPRGQAVLPQCSTRCKVERFDMTRVSTLHARAGAGHYFLPHPTMQYRVKYPLYRINATSAEEALRKVVKLLDGNLDSLISVEADHSTEPFWKRVVTGK